MVPPGADMREHKSVVDKRTGSMGVHWGLGQSSQVWVQEKAEPFKQFAECKEWEKELRDMQRNIEELYNEVKARREGSETGMDGRTDHDILSSSLHSTVSADSFNLHSNGHSLYQYNDGNSDSLYHHSNGICHSPFHANGDNIDLFSHHTNGWKDHADLNHYGCDSPVIFRSNSVSCPSNYIGHDRRHGVNELDEFLHGSLGQEFAYPISADTPEKLDVLSSNLQDTQLNCKHGTKNSLPLNAALDEIARLSEQFSTYQNEIRKKSGDGRSEMLSQRVCAGTEEVKNRRNRMSSLKSQQCDESWMHDTVNTQTGPPSGSKTSPFIHPSQHVNSSTAPNMELPAPVSIRDKKCVSPSVLRKFGLMLKENEGKTLTDSGVVTTLTPEGEKPHGLSSPGRINMSAVRKCSSNARTLTGCNLIKCPNGGLQQVDRDHKTETGQGEKKAKFFGSVENGHEFKEGLLEHWRPAPQSAVSNYTQGTVEEAGKSWERSGGCQQYRNSYLQHHDSSLLPVNWNSDTIKTQSSSCNRGLGINHKQGMQEERDTTSTASVLGPFSRPARPAKQRPPSRWARHLPVASTATFRALPESRAPRSFPCHMETVIM